MYLQLQNIVKGYGDPGTRTYRRVIDKLDLEATRGDKIAIVGPSGSGKTTLLNIMGTLDLPDKGTVIFDKKEISGYSGGDLANFRNKHLGFIFQLHHLLPQLTLLENVLLPVLPNSNGISKEQAEWAEYLIQKVGLHEQRDQKPGQLSGGECQRTAVVRALINKPGLLLADEPTGALDEENARALTDLLIRLSDEECITLITVTHSNSLADKMDNKYILRKGKLFQE